MKIFQPNDSLSLRPRSTPNLQNHSVLIAFSRCQLAVVVQGRTIEDPYRPPISCVEAQGRLIARLLDPVCKLKNKAESGPSRDCPSGRAITARGRVDDGLNAGHGVDSTEDAAERRRAARYDVVPRREEARDVGRRLLDVQLLAAGIVEKLRIIGDFPNKLAAIGVVRSRREVNEEVLSVCCGS